MAKLRGLQLGARAYELFESGLTNKQVAEALGQNYETVRKARAKWEQFLESEGKDVAPKTYDELAPEHKAMVGPYLAWERHRKACSVVDPGDPHWDEVHEPLIREAVNGFERFFDAFNHEGADGSKRSMAPHAREWIHDAFANRRLLLNVPPRHAKSTYLSVWLPLFLVCGNRDIQIILLSQTDDFAQKFTNEIVAHMETDDALISAFGRFVPNDGSPWAPRKGELMVAGRQRLSKPGDRTIQLRGARQQVLGMEADWIVGDDIDSQDKVRSDTERARMREWWDQQVMTRLSPKGRAVCIGQRLHINDIYGYLSKKRRTKVAGAPPMWNKIEYPAVLEWPNADNGHQARVLWPELWSYDELMYAYDELGEFGFESMYQQHPVPTGARIVKQEWIEGDETHPGCLDRDRQIGYGWRDLPGEAILPVSRVISVDPSPTENWGFVVADVMWTPESKQFNASILHVEGAQVSPPDAKRKVDFFMQVYGPINYFVWEWSAISNWLEHDPWYHELKTQTRVIAHKTHGKSKGDPELGVASLALELEFGRIRFPYGDGNARMMTDAFLEELYAWPDGDYDDRLMALWFIKYVYRALYPAHEDTGAWDVRGSAFDVDAGSAWDMESW